MKELATSSSGGIARCYLNNNTGAVSVQVGPTGAGNVSYVELDGLSGYPADA